MSQKVCFMGHRMFLPAGLSAKLHAAVEQAIQDGCRCFTMGTHGDFDRIALAVCRQCKAKYPALQIEVVLTSLAQTVVPADCDDRPYQDVTTVMYEIEHLHPKQRIAASNQQMIDSCDTMICYAAPDWHLTNGTWQAVRYAQKRGLKIINLALESGGGRVYNGAMAKVLVAMSGGVDSSVAAWLVKRDYDDCVGCTMQLVESGDGAADHGVADARAVAEQLQMPFDVCDWRAEFRECVIQPFVAGYERGVTPNPCVDCNRTMKFGRLYAQAQALGCDMVATGHYARIAKIDGQFYLQKAVDCSKDQSYFLYHLTQEQLAHTLFPLGHLTKAVVRDLAREHGLHNAEKRESQDICFVPHGDYAQVIARATGKSYPRGNFVDTHGRVLGQHRGIIHYTVGQRKGLAISADQRLYVQKICPDDNTVVLCRRDELAQSTARVAALHWINGVPAETQFRCHVKIRYNQKEQPATVTLQGDGTVKIIFDQPQAAVTPGQAAVFYQGDVVLGGGILAR